jgi:hypothetical protein
MEWWEEVADVPESEDWISLPQVAERAKIPETTARRYANTFKRFLTTKESGNITLYHPETVGILQKISERYRRRQTTDQIIEELRMSYGETFEIEGNHLPQRIGYAPTAPLEEIAKAMTALATQKEEVMALIEKQRRLEQRISELEAKQKREDALQGFLSWWKNVWKRGS